MFRKLRSYVAKRKVRKIVLNGIMQMQDQHSARLNEDMDQLDVHGRQHAQTIADVLILQRKVIQLELKMNDITDLIAVEHEELKLSLHKKLDLTISRIDEALEEINNVLLGQKT